MISDDEESFHASLIPQWQSACKGSEAAVVVLGDVGRSPRMCNHAIMLAEAGYRVKIFGFHDSDPEIPMTDHEPIEIVGIRAPPEMRSLPAAVQLPVKFVWNVFTLFFTLFFRTSHLDLRVILMQNPPGLPTMLVCYLISRLKTARLTVDWHNYTYSILRDKYNLEEEKLFRAGWKSAKEIIVLTVSFLEGICGRWLPDSNLCVSQAMLFDLKQRWGVDAHTLHDRAPAWKFRSRLPKEIHDLFLQLSDSTDGAVLRGKNPDETILTRISPSGEAEFLPTRPLVLLSSTSWTPDEKFEILLDALVKYDANFKTSKTGLLPKILMIITGKGPLKAMYLEEIRQKNLVSINILTPWLEAKDYPTIVGSADLGISLHTSTSGLDLPMKVVDMFGAKVPVLAKRFKCIGELVYDGINGRLFDDSEELYEQITELAKGFPADCPDLDMLKNHVRNHNYMPWETMWWKRATIRGVLVPPIRNQDMRRFMILLVILLFVIFLIVAPKWVV